MGLTKHLEEESYQAGPSGWNFSAPKVSSPTTGIPVASTSAQPATAVLPPGTNTNIVDLNHMDDDNVATGAVDTNLDDGGEGVEITADENEFKYTAPNPWQTEPVFDF